MTGLWAVVPAAGKGMRMGAECPKQYLELAGVPIISRTLQRLSEHPGIDGIVVALAEDDEYFPGLELELGCELQTVTGGAQRCDSVLAAVDYLQRAQTDIDWVLVHDAARPCVRLADIDRLISRCIADNAGGILASPVRDTMKRCVEGERISETVERSNLWHALTPQMFPLAQLAEALRGSVASGKTPTDEAQAMELAGHSATVVSGHSDNIKITQPEDLRMAQIFLQLQESDA